MQQRADLARCCNCTKDVRRTAACTDSDHGVAFLHVAAHLARSGSRWIELAEDVELRRGREVEQLLELSH